MFKEGKVILIFIGFIFLSSYVSAIPFIVGMVNDALDGTSANGREIVLWNPSVGINDNVTDIIGQSGNSGTDNIYLIDCALLTNGCEVGIEIRVRVTGLNGRTTNYTNVIINGAGFQQAENLTLNSISVFNYTVVDDSINNPLMEIDLNAGSTTLVTCQGVVYDADGENELENVSSRFFDSFASSYFGAEDNNEHYSNSSCTLDFSYGNANQAFFNCTHTIQYYSNSANWNCTASLTDSWNNQYIGSNMTFINPLLAIEVPSFINYGVVNQSEVSPERTLNVTNFGNVILNLSLEGYARTLGDNYSMNCTGSKNISVNYQKFNLTASNSGAISLAQFDSLYTNLTSTREVKRFNLAYRRNDNNPYLDDTNSTYWRIYAPSELDGSCSGNIIFGAEIGVGN